MCRMRGAGAVSLPACDSTVDRSGLDAGRRLSARSTSNSTPVRPTPVNAKLGLPDIETVTVELVKDAHGMGFTVAGVEDAVGEEGFSCGVFVDRIHEHGAAALDGRLRVGDQVLLVDGQTLIGKTHQACMNILRSTSRNVQLIVGRQRPSGAATPLQRSESEERRSLRDHSSQSLASSAASAPQPALGDSRSSFRQLSEGPATDKTPSAPVSPTKSRPSAELVRRALPTEAYKAANPGMKIIAVTLDKAGASGHTVGH